MTRPAGRGGRRSVALALLALLLAACAAADDTGAAAVDTTTPTATSTTATSPTASAPTAGDDGPTIVVDGPVMTLDPDEVAELTDDGRSQIIASAGSPADRVVVVLASDEGDGAIAAEMASVPAGVSNDLGGSGELLLPEDACSFATSTLGWTVVVTDAPEATVTMPLADGSTVEEQVRPAVVGDREIGVVLVEGTLGLDDGRPRVDPGGVC